MIKEGENRECETERERKSDREIGGETKEIERLIL